MKGKIIRVEQKEKKDGSPYFKLTIDNEDKSQMEGSCFEIKSGNMLNQSIEYSTTPREWKGKTYYNIILARGTESIESTAETHTGTQANGERQCALECAVKFHESYKVGSNYVLSTADLFVKWLKGENVAINNSKDPMPEPDFGEEEEK